MEKYLIFNADDFGASIGVNRGILESHRHGVVTSTSAMVSGGAIHDAMSISRDYPDLAIGLHWDVWGEDEREFDTSNLSAVRDEFQRQLDEFDKIFGRMPTHIDSHRHAHLEKHIFPSFLEIVEPLGIPLRGDGRVRFVGGFYAQWEWKVTDLNYVSVPFLQTMLNEEVDFGWTEFSCHPGFVSSDYSAVYLTEREEEVRTLTDPQIRLTVDELNIRLVSFQDYIRICSK